MGAISIIMNIIFIIGLVLITIGITKAYTISKQSKPVVIYQTIPQHEMDSQEKSGSNSNSGQLKNIFHGMFNKPTPWLTNRC